MKTIASALILLALGTQAQPLGSVADSQSLVRRTHSQPVATTNPTFVPVPVFVNGNGQSSGFRPAPIIPDYDPALGPNQGFQTTFQPVGQPSFQPVAVVPDFGSSASDFVSRNNPCANNNGVRSGQGQRNAQCNTHVHASKNPNGGNLDFSSFQSFNEINH